MPRVRELRPKYMSAQIGREIDSKRVFQRMTQEELAERIGTTQQNLSYKIRNNKFNYEDLIRIFAALELTNEEIIRWMKL